MADNVEVRVTKVKDHEINQLRVLVEALKDSNYNEVVKQNYLRKDYIVAIEPAKLSKIKEVLSVILQTVKADRIEIDT